MRRILLTMMGILLALVLAAPMVSAQSNNGGPPQNLSVTFGPRFIKQFPGHCSFPMQIKLSGKTKRIDQGNRGIIFTAPDETATIKNLTNGERATFNVTGASHKSTLKNGNVKTVITGRNLALDPVAGTVITIGRFSFVNDPSDMNNVVPLSGKGRLIDVCALLS